MLDTSSKPRTPKQAPSRAKPAKPVPMLLYGDHVEVATCLRKELQRENGKVIGAEGEFWFFNGKCWEAYQEHALRQRVQRYSGALVGTVTQSHNLHVSASFINGVLQCLGDQVETPDFFENPVQGVCCSEGFITLDKGEPKLIEYAAEQKHRFVLPGTWQNGAHTYGKLLRTLLDGCFQDDPEADAKKRCLRQLAGCVVTGLGTKVAAQKAFVLYGPGANNGKSQFLDMLKALVPPDAHASLSIDGLCNPYFTPQLAGKLLNVSDEDPNITLGNVGNFKKCITGNLVDGREVRRRRVQFKPIAQHVFAANRLPVFRNGMDKGVLRRLLIIMFHRTIPKEEQIALLGALIAAEEPGALLTWAINGASDLIKSGGFVAPASSLPALEKWATSADPIAAFVAATMQPAEGYIRLKVAYERFREWAVEEEGVEVRALVTCSEFSDRVSEQLGKGTVRVTGGPMGGRASAGLVNQIVKGVNGSEV